MRRYRAKKSASAVAAAVASAVVFSSSSASSSASASASGSLVVAKQIDVVALPSVLGVYSDGSSGGEGGVQSFGLAPTSSILLERHLDKAYEGRRRRRRLSHADSDEDARFFEGTREWAWRRFGGAATRDVGIGAVYAGLDEIGPSRGRPYAGRRRLLSEGTNDYNDDDDDGSGGEEGWWGAYVEEHDALARDFNARRRLSRHERDYRMERGISVDEDGDDSRDPDEDLAETGKSSDGADDDDGARRRRLQFEPAGQQQQPQPQQQQKPQPQQQQQHYQHPPPMTMQVPYQSAPLSQGYGTHYSTIWVGSPQPQRKSVIVDTGSHYTAFPCKGCQNCGEEHHTDLYFDPDLSQTFRVVKCGDCGSGARCVANRCTFSQSYTEGSSWRAYQATDQFFCGGGDADAGDNLVDRSFAIDFMFGCQTSETGLFVTQLADGIMGMSAHEATLPKQMWRAGKIAHNFFTLCFRQELSVSKEGINAGIMSLGGIDSRLNSSPMVYARNMARSGWYTVYVKNVFLRTGGGQSAATDDPSRQHVMRLPIKEEEMNSGKGVIVDSGTTDTYLHQTIAKAFGEAWREVTGKKYSNSAIRLSRDELMRLPTVLLQLRAYTGPDPSDPDFSFSSPPFPNLGLLDPSSTPGLAGPALDPLSPNDVLLAIPATHYMEYSPTRDVYTSRLYFTESRGGVLGANAMQGHNVLFDWENGRVGFAESTCEFTAGTILGDDSASLEQERFRGGVGQGTAGAESAAATAPLPVGWNDAYSALNADMGRDCTLTHPALERSCVDSVDLGECGGGADASVVLRGTERFSAVVTHGGFDGMSCEEVMFAAASSFGPGNQPSVGGEGEEATPGLDLDIEVSCDGAGMCFVSRPCSMTCGAAAEATSDRQRGGVAAAVSAATSTASSLSARGCGVTPWSACSESCVQSQAANVPFLDDLAAASATPNSGGSSPLPLALSSCWEDPTLRSVRSCHVDACGRIDPCRVPFVVHAIVGLGGTDAVLWDSGAEEAVREALSFVVNGGRKGDVGKRASDAWVSSSGGGGDIGLSKKKKGLFGPGDVRVLMASPWYPNEYASDAAGEGLGESRGTKVVVEISVFNPNAKLPAEFTGGSIWEKVWKGGVANDRSPNNWVGDNAMLRDATGTSRVGSVEEGVSTRSPGIPLATCDESDLYPLAKRALDVHVELGRSSFMPNLIRALRSAATAESVGEVGDTPLSPFAAPLADPENVGRSSLITSWTIRTDANGGSGGLHDHLLHDPRLRSKSRLRFYLTSPRFWAGIILMALSVWIMQQSFLMDRIVDLPGRCIRPCVDRYRRGGGGGLGEISEVDDFGGDGMEETWEVDYDRVPLTRSMNRSRNWSRSTRGSLASICRRNSPRETFRDEDVKFDLAA